jgi:hypothetical protein
MFDNIYVMGDAGNNQILTDTSYDQLKELLL